MGFNAATEWDVRTGGSDNNGGGFQVGATGTDRSVNNSAYIAFTDLVIDHTTNTKITSATHPFDATSPGNIINITGGAGFTVQRVQIVSVAAGVATCDKAVGTIDSTGGTGNLGGGLATVATAVGLWVNTNKIWVQTGTYTITASIGLGTTAGPFHFEGYASVHGDLGTAPLITTATDSTPLFTGSTSLSAAYSFKNINFSNTANTRSTFFSPGASGAATCTLCVMNSVLDGFSNCLGSNISRVINSTWINCEIKNCTTNSISSYGDITLNYCKIHNCTGSVYPLISGNIIRITDSLIVDITGYGIRYQTTLLLFNSTVANCSDNNVYSSATFNIITSINNIIYGSGATGHKVTSLGPYTCIKNNAYGDNDTADRSVVPIGTNDVTLTHDPFTDAANGDYTLNNTAGGGAACKGAGFQWGS